MNPIVLAVDINAGFVAVYDFFFQHHLPDSFCDRFQIVSKLQDKAVAGAYTRSNTNRVGDDFLQAPCTAHQYTVSGIDGSVYIWTIHVGPDGFGKQCTAHYPRNRNCSGTEIVDDTSVFRNAKRLRCDQGVTDLPVLWLNTISALLFVQLGLNSAKILIGLVRSVDGAVIEIDHSKRMNNRFEFDVDEVLAGTEISIADAALQESAANTPGRNCDGGVLNVCLLRDFNAESLRTFLLPLRKTAWLSKPFLLVMKESFFRFLFPLQTFRLRGVVV